MLGTRLRTWRYDWQKRELVKESRRVAAEARQKNDQLICDEWYADNRWRFDVIDSAINGIKTDDLVRQAEKFNLSIPDKGDEEKWEHDLPANHLVLTPNARKELGAAIQRARRESIEWWVKVVGGAIGIVTGLVGASIGLIAVLRGK